MTLREFFAEYGLRVFAVVVAAVVVSFAIFFSLNFFSQKSSVVKLENTPFFDNKTQSVVLTNNTVSLSGLQNCDIYVSGPSKQIKYFESVDCNSLSSTEISKDDMTNLFDNQKGTYTVIINSESNSQGRILQFAIQ